MIERLTIMPPNMLAMSGIPPAPPPPPPMPPPGICAASSGEDNTQCEPERTNADGQPTTAFLFTIPDASEVEKETCCSSQGRALQPGGGSC